MQPNSDDEVKEFSYGQLLIELCDRMVYEGKRTISQKEIVVILRCVFGFEDGRSHRNKINMILDKGYLRQINKTSYKFTELGKQRTRMARGAPVAANTQAAVADIITEPEVYDSDVADVEVDVNPLDYLSQLRGRRE